MFFKILVRFEVTPEVAILSTNRFPAEGRKSMVRHTIEPKSGDTSISLSRLIGVGSHLLLIQPAGGYARINNRRQLICGQL